MYFILTTAGIAYLKQNPVAPALSHYKLGHSYGYPPDADATEIVGPIVYDGVPSAPVIQNSNLLCYTIYLDRTVGPFSFGEVGLYLPDGTLFATGVNADPIFKTLQDGGNPIVIDCYVPTDTNVRAAFAAITNSFSQLRLPTLTSVEELPKATDTPSNAFIVPSPNGNESNLLAVAASNTWTITSYNTYVAEAILSADVDSGQVIDVSWINHIPYPPSELGEYICQFLTGPAAGTLRVLSGLTGHSLIVSKPIMEYIPENTLVHLYRAAQLPDVQTSFLSGLDPYLTAAEVNSLRGRSLANLISKDGSVAMTGELNLGGHRLTNVAYPEQPGDGVSLQALTDLTSASTEAIAALVSRMNSVESAAMLKTGVNSMAGRLNMANNKIESLADGVRPTDGVNVRQLTQAVASLTSVLSEATAFVSYSPPNSLPCTGALTTTSTWSLVKHGPTVTLQIQPVVGLASSAPSFSFGATIPPEFRPSFPVSCAVPVKSAGANQASLGVLVVYPSTGVISVFKDATATANFTAGADAGLGMDVGISLTWSV